MTSPGSFAEAAARLAGFAGAMLGWTPDAFWRATPAELAVVVQALQGDTPPPPPTRDEIAALMEAFPDG